MADWIAGLDRSEMFVAGALFAIVWLRGVEPLCGALGGWLYDCWKDRRRG